jgi:hypothetical protein
MIEIYNLLMGYAFLILRFRRAKRPNLIGCLGVSGSTDDSGAFAVAGLSEAFRVPVVFLSAIGFLFFCSH